MRSHECHFHAFDLIKPVLAPLLPVGVFALLMHTGAWMNWLPRPWPALDMDRTVLTCQAQAAQAKQPAHILLLGDSSCLMGVSALELIQQTGMEALSLATLSYVDLHAQGLMLRQWTTANSASLQTVVLLMHPEALRRPEPSAYHQNFLIDLLQGRNPTGRQGIPAHLERRLGLEDFRNRLLGRILPIPLPGRYGSYYGFTTDLCWFLAKEKGSAVDPNTFDRETARGNAEYRLARGLEEQSAAFRSQVPPGVRLAVGIMPSPVSFVPAQHEETSRFLLKQWATWLGADVILTNLPAVLPDSYFASSSHLNVQGKRLFTQKLGEELAREFKK